MRKLIKILGGNPIFLLIVIINIFLIILASYFWVYPAAASICDLNDSKVFWEQKNLEQDKLLADKKAVEKEWTIWQERKKMQKDEIPLKRELDEVFGELDILLGNAPPEISSFRTESREYGENDKFTSIGFKLEVNGANTTNPTKLLEFLKVMEEFNHPLSVENVSIYREKGSEEMQLEVSFKIYFHSG